MLFFCPCLSVSCLCADTGTTAAIRGETSCLVRSAAQLRQMVPCVSEPVFVCSQSNVCARCLSETQSAVRGTGQSNACGRRRASPRRFGIRSSRPCGQHLAIHLGISGQTPLVCACWWQLPALVRLNRVPCCPFRMPTLARWRCVAARASNRLCSTSRNGTSHRHCSYRNMGNISCLTMRTSGPRLLASAALPMMAARERWMPNKLPRKVTPNRVPVPGTRS